MFVQRFNQLLEKYSHNLTALRLLRKAINSSPLEDLFSLLAEKDEQEKGYFLKEEIGNIWFQDKSIPNEAKVKFINKKMNFEKIAYSILHNFIAGDLKIASETEQRQSLDLELQQLFNLQLKNFTVEEQIVQKMGNFIPMKFSRPSREEVQNYVICHQLTVDIAEISRAFNLLPTALVYKSAKSPSHFEESLTNPSVSNLQNIMKRLQSRVDGFGSEWLTQHANN